MIETLKCPPSNKIFFIGPPGHKSSHNKVVLELCDLLNYKYISAGDLLRKEISKKSELGFKIET